MSLSKGSVLTINGGSSSIKFALFDVVHSFKRLFEGKIERIGLSESVFRVKGLEERDTFSYQIEAPDYTSAVTLLMNWLQPRLQSLNVVAVGHRVVHGGSLYSAPEQITEKMIENLSSLIPFDPAHMPEEILLMKIFHLRLAQVPQWACFDTAFHHDLPRVAKMLPIPRRYEAWGVRKYGFHGLSYEFLMGELNRLGGSELSQGRVILAHLGSGSSLSAVYKGKSIDTSMSFTPAAGVPMATRSGDLDPGLFLYLARHEKMSVESFNEMINFQSGLLGVSETSSDMQDLLKKEAEDFRASEAVNMFCYHVKKGIGSFAAVLGGLDTLVFSGGIGENAPIIRSRICDGLGFLGIDLDEKENSENKSVISAFSSPVSIRVIHTDEEWMIAKTLCHMLDIRAKETQL